MTVAVVVLAVALAGSIAANIALAWAAIARADTAGRLSTERAVAAGRAENAEAEVETSERLRQAEKRRGDALEEEIHALEADVAVPGAPGTGRNRLLRALREANDAAAGDSAAAPRGAAGELPDAASAEAAEDGPGPARVPGDG